MLSNNPLFFGEIKPTQQQQHTRLSKQCIDCLSQAKQAATSTQQQQWATSSALLAWWAEDLLHELK